MSIEATMSATEMAIAVQRHRADGTLAKQTE
jgi:hypothetical protein